MTRERTHGVSLPLCFVEMVCNWQTVEKENFAPLSYAIRVKAHENKWDRQVCEHWTDAVAEWKRKCMAEEKKNSREIIIYRQVLVRFCS